MLTCTARLNTPQFSGYSVQFSPYFEYWLACASGANFGVVGNGRLWLFDQRNLQAPPLCWDTQDGLFDLAWNEANENQLVVSSGDGSVQLFDVNLAGGYPIRKWRHAHEKEVSSICWNLVAKDSFLTASWDGSVKLWHPESEVPLQVFLKHAQPVNEAMFSPHHADLFGSVGSDQSLNLWQSSSPGPVLSVPMAHAAELLSLDWNKYQDRMIATSSADRTVKIWDLRMTRKELAGWLAHGLAVKRVRWSPHSADLLLTTSYDMSVQLWHWSSHAPAATAAVRVAGHDLHTEFVLGVDWNLYVEGQVATCAWDQQVHLLRCPPSL